MILLSLVLVIIAAVTLVLGVFQDGLTLIYVSIGTCLAAMVLLGVGVLMRRREDAEPAGYGAGGQGRGVAPDPQPGADANTEDVRVRDTTAGAETTEVRPARKAVVKKVAAASPSAAETDHDSAASPFQPESDAPDEQESTASGAASADAGSPADAGSTAEDANDETAATSVTGALPTDDAGDEPDAPPISEAGDDATGGSTADAPAAAAMAGQASDTVPPVTRKVAVKKATAKTATAKKAPASKAPATTTTSAGVSAAAGSAGALPAVRGLGPAKAKALLDHFGSVEELRKADITEITAVKGIGEVLARQLKHELGDA